MEALSKFLRNEYGDEEIDDEEEIAPNNPFLDGNDLLERLDELKRRSGSDFSSRKAVLTVLSKFPHFAVYRLLSDHKYLDYQPPLAFCRAIQADRQTQEFNLV